MKFYTYKLSEQAKQELAIGDFENESILYPLSQFDMHFTDMNELIARITPAELEMLKTALHKEELREQLLKINRADTIPCAAIPHPKQDVICLGINYMAHAEESARYKEEAFGGERPYAIYFAKRVNEAVADGGSIPAYENLVDSLDYEAELAVVIGKDAKNVSKEDAYDYIFGYTVLNDMSARNLQTRHKQWYFGKSLDGFTPIGPCIATIDAFENPPALAIKSYVNGELRQNSNTNLLIFDIAHIISELSQGMTLKAGTIIATGTPAGVGMGFVPPNFLKPGDVVACEIEGIGTITNTIK
ncbi:MAG: fumarylacetoacetate hydrolase family protein [Peptococcaceae bacterium]|nr:fumarylacetoacetate hydrolase family protein [Peptococcaceae bacterium]MBO5301512.1 fumarylacetoacetate hydrolase family protein [Peptococcaceae bacterium]MBO5428777.1 fumarylacetoacetate hydrolase family protein [Peptococcaceae bacterium]